MRWLVLLALIPCLLKGTFLGFLSDPWAPWQFAGRGTETVSGELPPAIAAPVDPNDLQLGHGFVSDAQRYLLARAAGWSPDEAIIATAISIAEDGSGDPSILSPLNSNGTRDLGLWQINSAHWPEFGGQHALIDPFTNARAGHVIYTRQGWCAWSTYGDFNTCHVLGHNNAYLGAMSRARAAASQPPPPAGQA